LTGTTSSNYKPETSTTPGDSYKLETTRSRLELRRNPSEGHRVTSHWNKLSEKVVQAEMVNTFKNKYWIKSGALSNYKPETSTTPGDSYKLGPNWALSVCAELFARQQQVQVSKTIQVQVQVKLLTGLFVQCACLRMRNDMKHGGCKHCILIALSLIPFLRRIWS